MNTIRLLSIIALLVFPFMATTQMPAANLATASGGAGSLGEWWSAVQAGLIGDEGPQPLPDAAAEAVPLAAEPLDLAVVWTAEGEQRDARYGYSVSSAGDIDGDGFSDVIVGSYYYSASEGEPPVGQVYIYHAKHDGSGLDTTPMIRITGDQAGAWFGYSVSGAGDVNHDGYDDVIIGAPRYDLDGMANGHTFDGRAYIYFGSPTGLSASAYRYVQSNQAGAFFGASVASVGSVNADAYADVIVGAQEFDNGQVDEGAAFVFYGPISANGQAPAWTAEGNQAGAGFGNSVDSAGDVNGDGRNDVIIGAYLFDNPEENEGAAFVYHGQPSGLSATRHWTGESNQVDARYGYSVSSAGDVNKDGQADVIVSAVWYDNGQSDEGRVYVYHGSATGVSPSPAWMSEGDQDGADYGWSVSSAGDVNGDTFTDVIIGAPKYDHGETDEGRAFVYAGSAGGLSATPIWMAESDQSLANFGWSVSKAGYVDQGTNADVVIGAHLFDNAGVANVGRVYIYHNLLVPTPFQKTYPINGFPVPTLNPILSWAPSLGSTKYKVCLTTTAPTLVDDCPGTLWDEVTGNTLKQYPGLIPHTTYYWHVMAVNADGSTYANGSKTAYWTFFTGDGTFLPYVDR